MRRIIATELILLLTTLKVCVLLAWSPPKASTESRSVLDRRSFLISSCCLSSLLVVVAPPSSASATAVRAVGSGEQRCRESGNCLETGEWDGAIGWEWGGKDRCDALDPNCMANGQLRTSGIIGKPIPTVPTKLDEDAIATKVRFTHVAAIQIDVGKNEVGVLKLGFYGNEAKESVQELIDFLSNDGLLTGVAKQGAIGTEQVGVSLANGGVVTSIVPSSAIELGVPSQASAFARSRGRPKAGDGFQPQTRPGVVQNDGFVRPHDCAGLVSLPNKGLGYGGTGFVSDDECYESAFLITADAMPAFDKSRRVVGQVLDGPSMAFLERLANIPTKRGIRGVIPGQTSGPPLPKVVVRGVQVSKVAPV